MQLVAITDPSTGNISAYEEVDDGTTSVGTSSLLTSAAIAMELAGMIGPLADGQQSNAGGGSSQEDRTQVSSVDRLSRRADRIDARESMRTVKTSVDDQRNLKAENRVNQDAANPQTSSVKVAIDFGREAHTSHVLGKDLNTANRLDARQTLINHRETR